MEAKVSQLPKNLFFSKSNITPTSLPHAQRFCLESFEHKKDALRKRFQGLAEKWKSRVDEQWKDQNSSPEFIVHVVKEGETLTSISRLYGVSVQSIAVANEKIVDINLVFGSQRLNIPSRNGKPDYMWKTRLYCINARDRCRRSLNVLGEHGNQMILHLPSSRHFQLAKRKGYFLVLVPLIAFCISCIISAFRHRLSENLKYQVVSEQTGTHHGPRGIRWKTALSDIREVEFLDAELAENPSIPPEDQPADSFEDMSHAYTEIEPAYQKFLAECGMSESGYWRGGSRD